MTHIQIIERFKRGDFVLAGQMLGISTNVAKFSFKRTSSKKYELVKTALIKIIENREGLITQTEVDKDRT